MRLSAELILSAEQRANPLGERELILRGYGIPTIEHLGATQDAYDAIDLSENRISSLENIPRLKRLSHLNLTRNLLERIDGRNLHRNVPHLQSLIVMDNRLSRFAEIQALGEGCPELRFLSLIGNPVIRRQHYRLYTIAKIPSLKVLDFSKIQTTERERAKRLFQSAAGAALEQDVQLEVTANANANSDLKRPTFVPGGGSNTNQSYKAMFTVEEKEAIRNMVANASSPQEIEYIEQCVQRGEFPSLNSNSSSKSKSKFKEGDAMDPPAKKAKSV